jgi:hypothetical protein
MSLRLNPAGIAEAALLRIGSTSWHDQGANGTKLSIALQALDGIVAELAGTERLGWLVPSAASVSLSAGVQEYDLSAVLDPDGEFFLRAYRVDGDNLEEVDLLRRIEWDAIEDRLTRTGQPESLIIQRSPSSLMSVYPIPDQAYTLKLTFQTAAPDLTQSTGTVDHGFPEAWQRYLTLALAADIGAGPVEKLPEQEIDRLLKQADEAKRRLVARNIGENVRRPRFTRAQAF